YSSARDRLEQARMQHPEQFIADNLVARLTEVTTLAGGRGPGVNTGGSNTGGTNTGTGGGTNIALDPRVVEGQRLAQAGKDFLSQGKYAEADAAFASALKSDPKNQDAVNALAKASRFRELRDR